MHDTGDHRASVSQDVYHHLYVLGLDMDGDLFVVVEYLADSVGHSVFPSVAVMSRPAVEYLVYLMEQAVLDDRVVLADGVNESIARGNDWSKLLLRRNHIQHD